MRGKLINEHNQKTETLKTRQEHKLMNTNRKQQTLKQERKIN